MWLTRFARKSPQESKVFNQDINFRDVRGSVVAAIQEGELDNLKRIMTSEDRGVIPFKLLSKNKKRFVLAAIRADNLEILKYLVRKFEDHNVFVKYSGGFLTFFSKNKEQFIVEAIKSGHLGILTNLLERVSSPVFKDMNSKMSLVEFAIRKGNKDIVKALLNKLGSAHAEALIFQGSFVPVAIFEGQSDILEVLLAKLTPEQLKFLISEESLFVAIHKGIAVFRLLFEKLCGEESATASYKKFLDILPKSRLVNEVCRTGDVDLMMFVLGHPRLFSHNKGGNNLDRDAYKLLRALLRKRASIPQKAWLENSCAQTFLTTVQKLKQQVKIEKEETGFRSFWRRIVSFFSYGRDSKGKCLERAEKIDLFDIALQYSDADLKTFVSKIKNASIVDSLRERFSNDLGDVYETNRLLSVLSNDRVVAVIDTLTSEYNGAELSAFIKKLNDDNMAIYMRETSSGDSTAKTSRTRSRSEEQGNSSTLSLRLFSPRNSQISDDVKPQTFADPRDDNGAPRCRAGII